MYNYTPGERVGASSNTLLTLGLILLAFFYNKTGMLLRCGQRRQLPSRDSDRAICRDYYRAILFFRFTYCPHFFCKGVRYAGCKIWGD